MSESLSLREVPFDDLVRRCAQENDRFHQHLEHDLRYCFEIFRRAIVEGDGRAWEIFEDQFRAQIARWVQKYAGYDPAGDRLEDLVRDAFRKIWVAFATDKNKLNNFPNFRRWMKYLKMCVRSVSEDARRADKRFVDVSDDVSDEPEQDRPSAQEIWAKISSRLKDEKERLVITALFLYGIKPQELYNQFPHRFSSPKEIYRVKQNVMARLRRDSEFKDLFDQDA